jgi:hypothetical protein
MTGLGADTRVDVLLYRDPGCKDGPMSILRLWGLGSIILAEPCFLHLVQNPFTEIVKEVPKYNESECNRVQPVNL